MAKNEISQLVDVNGIRPASNGDAVKIHGFLSLLPIYRRKNDWKVPLWLKTELVALQTVVYKEIVSIISTEIEQRCGVTFGEKENFVMLLKNMTAKFLYRIILSLSPEAIVNVLLEIIRGRHYEKVLSKVKDENYMAEHFNSSKHRKTCGKYRQGLTLDLGAFWANVADAINHGKRSINGFRLSTDCCIKFINSNEQGQLLTDVTKDEEERITSHITQLEEQDRDPLDNVLEDAQTLNVTAHQYLLVCLRKQRDQHWTPEEDAMLLDAAYEQLSTIDNAHQHPRISWKTVASRLPGRNNEQCRLRWREAIKVRITDKQFTVLEMARLELLRSAYGENWTKIATFMPGRSASQCRWIYNRRGKTVTESDYWALYDDIQKQMKKRKLKEMAFYKIPKEWKRVDWLGYTLLKIACATGDETIYGIIKDFYKGPEIKRRISVIFRHQTPDEKCPRLGADNHLLTLSDYLSRNHPQHAVITNELVIATLRSLGRGRGVKRRNVMISGPVSNTLEDSLPHLLAMAWP